MMTEAQRLAALRATDATGAYADSRTATGLDSSRSVQVTIDPTNRVMGVHIEHLADAARTPRGVAALVEEAYVDAVVSKFAPRPAAQSSAPPTAMTVDRRAEIRLDNIMYSDRAVSLASAQTPRFPYAGAVGRSENGYVTVTLPPAQSLGALDFDSYWLDNATRADVGRAITQAYAAAYRERDRA